MLPWPFLPAFFAFAELVGLAGAGLAFFGAVSSSEKDSQTASSLVTMHSQWEGNQSALATYQDSRPRP